jgi:hypothetical protein
VKEVAMPVQRNGETDGYMIFCPACKCGHLFDKRWWFNGNLEKPTFKESMLVCGGAQNVTCHSYVTDGMIQFLPDSTHALAGQTVELKPLHEEEESPGA